MEKIIKKAIEGGYELKVFSMTEFLLTPNCKNVLLDSLFWQALGKACRWQAEVEWEEGGWLYYALFFYRKILTEGWDAAVKYLESLLSN